MNSQNPPHSRSLPSVKVCFLNCYDSFGQTEKESYAQGVHFVAAEILLRVGKVPSKYTNNLLVLLM